VDGPDQLDHSQKPLQLVSYRLERLMSAREFPCEMDGDFLCVDLTDPYLRVAGNGNMKSWEGIGGMMNQYELGGTIHKFRMARSNGYDQVWVL
jgi:hypothetical protein